MPYAVSGASRLYYEVHGEGQAIVLAHGIGGNHASWFNQVPTLARSFRVISFDHRGFGKSEDIEKSGRSAFVDDLTQLLDALEIDRAILVGQSMGGGTVAAFTCRRPDRVRALVHCDSLSGIAFDEPHGSALRRHNESIAGLSQVERVLGPSFVVSDPERTLLYLQLAGFNSVNRKTITGVQPRWSPRELAATGIPALFVAGAEDVIFPPALIRAVHEQTPGSRYVEIPRAGHSAYFEQPQTFNRVLLDFLQGLDG